MPPVGGAPLAREREKRYMDLVMLANFNARDRPTEAYESLFAQADDRFEFLGIKSIESSELSLIEASEKHITLPPDKLSWLLEQPDHVASAADFHYEILAGRYAWTDSSINQILFHEHVIHKSIARKDAKLLGGMWDEIRTGLILRVVNRALVGLPLCRNRDYLAHVDSFTTNVLVCTFATRLTPSFLRHIVGLHHLAHRPRPRRGPPLEFLAPDFIARCLMALEFAAIKTPAATLARVLLDVCGSGPASGYLERLRAEAEQVYAAHDRTWSKQTLRRMA
ncbi:hypothetical protein PG994_008100 [Apiospora phragmitis]|uniref:Uncharacterized protein n=1 Tax=Apiospora phragmitis TaxID=2905665 RepID=A0ABR1US36_9PEZI